MATKCFPTSAWWPPSCDMCVSIHVLIKFPYKIILLSSRYQLHSCIFYVGLAFPSTRMEASTHFWISFCSNFSPFWHVHVVSLSNARMWSQTFRPQSNTTKKLFIFNINGVLCYFPKCALFQGDQWKIGKNLDVSRLEIHARVQDS